MKFKTFARLSQVEYFCKFLAFVYCIDFAPASPLGYSGGDTNAPAHVKSRALHLPTARQAGEPCAFDACDYFVCARVGDHDCQEECKGSKKSQACFDFCDCIHNEGLPFDSCLGKYNKAPEDPI